MGRQRIALVRYPVFLSMAFCGEVRESRSIVSKKVTVAFLS
jgi:hypothetical protein